MIDLTKLIEKYMNHVYDCEGSDFLCYLNSSFSNQTFTEEEVEFLKNVGKEEEEDKGYTVGFELLKRRDKYKSKPVENKYDDDVFIIKDDSIKKAP